MQVGLYSTRVVVTGSFSQGHALEVRPHDGIYQRILCPLVLLSRVSSYG